MGNCGCNPLSADHEPCYTSIDINESSDESSDKPCNKDLNAFNNVDDDTYCNDFQSYNAIRRIINNSACSKLPPRHDNINETSDQSSDKPYNTTQNVPLLTTKAKSTSNSDLSAFVMLMMTIISNHATLFVVYYHYYLINNH